MARCPNHANMKATERLVLKNVEHQVRDPTPGAARFAVKTVVGDVVQFVCKQCRMLAEGDPRTLTAELKALQAKQQLLEAAIAKAAGKAVTPAP